MKRVKFNLISNIILVFLSVFFIFTFNCTAVSESAKEKSKRPVPLIINKLNYIFTGSGCTDLITEGNYAYVVNPKTGLTIFDITDPEDWTFISNYDPDHYNLKAVKKGNFIFISDYYSRISIINISNVSQPLKVGSINKNSAGSFLAIKDNYLYAMGYEGTFSALQIFDITDIAAPVFIKSIVIGGRINGLKINNNYAYIYGQQGLVIVDITTPADSDIIKTLEVCTYYDSEGLAFKGNYAYVSKDNKLHVIDITTPSSAYVIKSINISYLSSLTYSGNYIFASCNQSGFQTGNNFHIIDITSPEDPAVLSSLNILAGAYDNFYYNNYVFLSGNNGINIIDVAEKNNPALLNSISAGGYCYKSIKAGSFLYSIDGYSGFNIHNITDIQNPQLIKKISLDNYSRNLLIKGNYAYVLSDTTGLTVIDISNTANAHIVKQTALNAANPTSIVNNGNYLFVGGSDKLLLLDITAADNPSEISSVAMSGTVKDIIFNGGYLFAGDSYGLKIIDISDINNPFIKNSMQSGDYGISGLIYNQNYIYASGLNNGLSIINVSNINNLTTVKVIENELLNSGAGANKLFIADNKLFVNDNYSPNQGLSVLDITNITNPAVIYKLILSGGELNVFVENNRIFLSGNCGVIILGY